MKDQKPKPSQPPKRLRKDHRRCTQIQCSHFQTGHCKACEECKARPFEINTGCKRCRDCEGVPGNLRWDDPNAKEMSEKEMEKAALQTMIEVCYKKLKEIENKNQQPAPAPKEPEHAGEIILKRVQEVNKNGSHR